MRGTLYAIGEIIVFLAIATAIGVAMGVLIGRSRAPRAAAVPTTAGAAGNSANGVVGELKARIKALEAERAAGGSAADRVAELEKELAVAEWQINTLEEEVANAREVAPE